MAGTPPPSNNVAGSAPPPPFLQAPPHTQSHQKQIACCSLKLLCVAPLLLLPTHCTYCHRTFSVAFLLMDLDSITLFLLEQM